MIKICACTCRTEKRISSSFYEKAVREKILQSFERGIKKSLPPAILQDEELMEDFILYAGASEPAAYASCALGESYECIAVAGGQTIILKTKEAYVNRKRIAELLRPFWEENIEESNELFDTPQSLKLYSKTEDKIIPVELKLNRQRLEECLTERIRRGVDNFFEALLGAFKNPDVLPIHILLAGNSCKSSIVRNLFEEKIREKEKELEEIMSHDIGQDKKVSNIFVLHMPLFFDPDEANKKAAEIHDADEDNYELNQNYERLRTGKTGVAFGLLRSREGGRDIEIIGSEEAPFKFYMGEIDANDCFQIKINLDVPYNQWKRITKIFKASTD